MGETTETWRVVDEAGAIHEAGVSAEGGGLVVRLALGDLRVAPCSADRVRHYVAMAARAVHIQVAEVLAPGQVTRAAIERERDAAVAEAAHLEARRGALLAEIDRLRGAQ